MTRLWKGRRGVFLAGLAAALSLGGSVAATTPASAATTHVATARVAVVNPRTPLSAQGCNGDTCMFLSTPSGGEVYIQAWAYDVTFYGHFQLTGPNGLNKKSYDGTWYAGKTNYYQWNEIPAVVGQYCVTGWTKNSNGTYTQNGRPCESIL